MTQYPLSFYVAVIVLLGLIIELWYRRAEQWALPVLVVYITTGAWYFADPILYEERYQALPSLIISYSYWEVIVFLGAFRLLVPFCSRKISPPSAAVVPLPINAESMLPMVICFWAMLLVGGVSRMEWDVLGALFPLDARAGTLMWGRAAAGDAGPMGFLISTGSYLYLATCSVFGILAVLAHRPLYKLGATMMSILTWPFFLLSGTRSLFLAVSTPWVLGYILFGRQSKVIRFVTLVMAFLALNVAFKIMLSHRNVGLREWLAGTEDADVAEANKEVTHEGLNMIEELCFINIFQLTGLTHLTLGEDYLTQLVSVVPRAIWAGKPLTGIEYAKLRGFAGGDTDIGVVATLSTGMIGQGVLEFGPFFGPLAPSLLMALWCGLLTRWWRQRASILRMGLFLFSLGITFNLGRNITSITLWPVIFIYVIVRMIEGIFPSQRKRAKKTDRRLGSRPSVVAVEPARAARPAVALKENPAGPLSQT